MSKNYLPTYLRESINRLEFLIRERLTELAKTEDIKKRLVIDDEIISLQSEYKSYSGDYYKPKDI